jgi:hypothetical protein
LGHGYEAEKFSISEAARELGLSAEWLRQGEKRGSLPPARRDRNGYRYYTQRISSAWRGRDKEEVVASLRYSRQLDFWHTSFIGGVHYGTGPALNRT